MKKLLSVLIVMLMVFTLVGCSGGNNGGSGSGNSGAEIIKIGVTIYKFDDPFMTAYRNNIQAYFDNLNKIQSNAIYELNIVDAANDADKQADQINTFISQGVDGLIVNLVQTNDDTLAKTIDASGIPAVFINREIFDYVYGDNSCYVGGDGKDSGIYQGQIIFNQLNHGDINEDGTVSYIMIMGDEQNPEAQYRTEYSIKYLQDNGVKLEELYKETANWDREESKELVTAELAKEGSAIEVIFCNNDAMALGALEAINDAGLVVGKDLYLVGVDALEEACESVLDGTMTGTVLNDDLGQATTACESLLTMIVGGNITNKVNYVPYVMVTKDNAYLYLK